MKTTKFWFNLLLMGCILTFLGCNDDNETQPDLEIESIIATGADLETGENVDVDLNGAASAEDVPLTPEINVTFSREVDAATATNTNFALSSADGAVPMNVSTNGAVVTLSPQEELSRGTDYTLTVSDAVAAQDGGAFTSVTRMFKSAGVGEVTPPQENSQVAYWPLDGNTEAAVGTFTTVFEQVSWDTDRHGFVNSAANFNGATEAGNGDLIEFEANEAFISPSMTISLWFKVNSEDYAGSRFMFGMGVERGYFMELGSDGIAWMKLATSHMLDPDPQNHMFATSWTDPNGDGGTGGQVLQEFSGSISDLVADGEWHQLVMTFDASSSFKTIFIDGNVLMQVDIDSETDEWFLKDMTVNEEGVADLISKNLALGYAGGKENQATGWAVYGNAENTYKGLMDDVRIFNTALTESEVQTLYNAEK